MTSRRVFRCRPFSYVPELLIALAIAVACVGVAVGYGMVPR